MTNQASEEIEEDQMTPLITIMAIILIPTILIAWVITQRGV